MFRSGKISPVCSIYTDKRERKVSDKLGQSANNLERVLRPANKENINKAFYIDKGKNGFESI